MHITPAFIDCWLATTLTRNRLSDARRQRVAIAFVQAEVVIKVVLKRLSGCEEALCPDVFQEGENGIGVLRVVLRARLNSFQQLYGDLQRKTRENLNEEDEVGDEEE